MPEPLYVTLVWHMHQPYYRDDRAGTCSMPWVRLHGLKDYYDMPAHVARTTGANPVRATFNLVPSLVEQLHAYERGASDDYRDLALRAGDWDHADCTRALQWFFDAHPQRMIATFPRYAELYAQRGERVGLEEIAARAHTFSAQDARDLSALFTLAWMGSTLRREPAIADLVRKGRDFSRDDLAVIDAQQMTFLSGILPYYRKLADEGTIEISVSPGYHPILPLLCNTAWGARSRPGLPMPEPAFVAPQDAARHLELAVQMMRDEFGRGVSGLWPSEGSVCEEILPLVIERGFRWLASDDEVLLHSLQGIEEMPGQSRLDPGTRYRAYRLERGGGETAIFFRDHFLSDRIGFDYASWDGATAAADLVSLLTRIHKGLPAMGGPFVCPIILDGENAWEAYADNGELFFRALYHGLAASHELRAVTPTDFLDRFPAQTPLPVLHPGSWINRDFNIWIGHREKNQAWSALALARASLSAARDKAAPDVWLQAERELLIAEGSDWFWWYGDDNYSAHDAEFDALFRTHLRYVYELLGQQHPAELDGPFIDAYNEYTPTCRPTQRFTPTLDGRDTHFYEWYSAGLYTARGLGGAQHRATGGGALVQRVHYGFDEQHFYMRVDWEAGSLARAAEGAEILALDVLSPNYGQARVRCVDGRWNIGWFTQTPEGRHTEKATLSTVAVDTVMELSLPLALLGVKPGERLSLVFWVSRSGGEIERFPHKGILIVPIPSDEDQVAEWSV